MKLRIAKKIHKNFLNHKFHYTYNHVCKAYSRLKFVMDFNYWHTTICDLKLNNFCLDNVKTKIKNSW